MLQTMDNAQHNISAVNQTFKQPWIWDCENLGLNFGCSSLISVTTTEIGNGSSNSQSDSRKQKRKLYTKLCFFSTVASSCFLFLSAICMLIHVCNWHFILLPKSWQRNFRSHFPYRLLRWWWVMEGYGSWMEKTSKFFFPCIAVL